MPHRTVRSEHDDWMDDNTRGLSLAAAAEWDEATEAFAAAADVLARRASDENSHDALALILGNLAQACFRAGRTDDALQHAQRACALRAAIAGEDAMPVARARMDLAVMLGASGRLGEAKVLIQRAIAAAERHVGDNDLRLVTMLDNGARIALAAGDPTSAEPLLLRLHALLDVYGMSTQRADRLIDKMDSLRTRTDTVRAPAHRAEVAAAESARAAALSDAERAAGAELAVYAHASIAEQDEQDEQDAQDEHDEWGDDRPLRDAVAVTDVLLRTTPPGVIAVQPPLNHDADILATFEMVVDMPVEPMRVDPIRVEPMRVEPLRVEPLREVVDERPAPDQPPSLDLVDIFDFPLSYEEEPFAAFDIAVEHGYGDLGPPAPAPDAGIDLTELAIDLAASASRADLLPPPSHPLTSRDMAPSILDALDAADAEAARTQMASRVAPTRRTAKSNRRVQTVQSNRAAIGAAIGAALAASGAVWYFLLR
jgi:Tetratricopeptide repeat